MVPIVCNGSRNNVKNWFYRIEFQGQGTAHIHLLVWQEDISKCSYEQIRADIPIDDRELAFLVHDLQQSEKTVLPLNENRTCLTTDNNCKFHLSLHCPQRAFALKLRAYMHYVTNCVSKFKDSQSTEYLYSTHLVLAEAAYHHLRDMKPCEPEMVMVC